MKLKNVYLLLSIAGAVVPLVQFVPWIAEHGINLRLLVQELFANRISSFFGLDVIMSAIVLIVFAYAERSRGKLRLWWFPMLAVLGVGVSFGLPLLLYLRNEEPAPLGSSAVGR